MTEARKSYTFTITFDDGRTREATITQGKVKLKVLRMIEQAQKSNQWTDMIPAIAATLRITPEEADEIELDDWIAMGNVLNEPPIPNASAPPTAE